MSPPQLDHIIILVPYSTLTSIPSSLTSNFKISPGGRHADNKTENRLIILRDGVYLELIAFVDDDPKLKHGHWWGELPNGIIDFALTSTDVKDVESVRRELEKVGKEGAGVTYGEARAGGRKRPDGEEVKWYVTFPEGLDKAEGVKRGSVPFWCHDVTDRELRVPAHDEVAVGHPSGAVGVRELVLGVPKGRLEGLSKTYAAILGEEVEDQSRTWSVGTPFGSQGSASIKLESAEVDDARVVRLVIETSGGKSDSPTSIDEVFGNGNHVVIDFRSAD